MENVTCMFCLSDSSDRTIIIENGYTGKKCDKCGLVYISPRPSSSEIGALYEQDKAHIAADSHVASSFEKRLSSRHHLKILRRFARSGTLLEIGPGGGSFLSEARRRGFDVYGIELNPMQASFIRDNLRITCDKRPLGEAFEGMHFDVIYHGDVLSHFYDPRAEFSHMFSRLQPGGILMFETGNGDFDEKYLKMFPSFQYPDHLFFFSERNVCDLLKTSGFELISLCRWSILPQLRLLRCLRIFARKASDLKRLPALLRKRSLEPSPAPQTRPHSSPRATLKHPRPLRFAYGLLMHFMRYKIGYLFPKASRPFTMIVVARKPSSE